MKITNVKAMVAKMFTVGLLAGAVVMAAPAKANAQVAVGVRVGPARVFVGDYPRPVVVAPAPFYGYYRPGFYGPVYRPGPVFYGHPWDHRFYRR